MSILVNAHQLSKAFAARPLFDGISFSVESQERIGLIGPNGAGKSTLLRILAGQISPDSGTLSFQRGLRVGFLEQVPRFSSGGTVLSSVLEGARDPHDGEEIARAYEILSHLSLDDGEAPVDRLSGGWRKRVALARELLRRPDLLLLDEPTNHLDIESILWLEELIARAAFATVTITHDRLFLQRVSNRILELDRRNPGGLLSVAGDYADFLETKQDRLAAQEKQEERLRNTLRRETEWLRQGAKARTTKQQARIQRAEELKQSVEELAYRNQAATARLDFQAAEKNPRKLIEAQGISKAYGGRTIIPRLDLLVTAGSRIGLLGPNGCGKSTLLRMLLGEETPDTGTVMRSEHLKVAYFEQNRESLDPELTAMRTVCPLGDTVEFRGARIHVKSYLTRFLFTYEQMGMAVGKLSGGEQSRLLLARLMLQEANLLVLDEPTNDLDVATLDVLEEVLAEFGGAVFLVTHDRYFLDQVARKILAFGQAEDGKPEIVAFTGLAQWEDWHERQERLRARLAARPRTTAVAAPVAQRESSRPADEHTAPTAAREQRTPAVKRKLSYKDQRDLDMMEGNIQKAEARVAALEAESARPEVATDAVRLAELSRELSAAHAEVDRLYARWAELEG
ncbi:MAG: ABC-F family ATP-binding cassette domain-containing protein [Oligoflexia bacterium]|nr:ABC-F family ATP-binding cassette domain-containing protein [Oligoflexia bacterium]